MRTTEKLANLTLRGLSHALLQLPITRFRNDIDLPNGRTYRANWEDPDCHIKCRNGVPWSVRSDEGDPIKHPVSYIERKIAEFERDRRKPGGTIGAVGNLSFSATTRI